MKNYYSTAVAPGPAAFSFPPVIARTKRIESIDLLRGVVMIIMALDHVRDYFHKEAFLYEPTDLSKTSVILFFTRWITHFCAPVFVLLAGTSAYLQGLKKSKKELSTFLFTRGLSLVLIELFVVGFFRTFNPAFPHFTLQTIWSIGICMMCLSGLIYLRWQWILLIGAVLICGHNLLDSIHVEGNNLPAFFWSLLHDVGHFHLGNTTIYVHYPLLPWIGLMAVGYCLGRLYGPSYNADQRKGILVMLGAGAIILFIALRSGNWYGDAAHWSVQQTGMFSLLSFINVTKYPPSLQYVLLTIGPALLFLAFSEKPLNAWKQKVIVFGRVPMFYYLAHILLIHVFAMILIPLTGHHVSDMILSGSVLSAPQLKGYGFNLAVVYLVYITLVVLLYPVCKQFDQYKRANISKARWLSYI